MSWRNSVLIATPFTVVIFGMCVGIDELMGGLTQWSPVIICTVVGFVYSVWFIRVATKWWGDDDRK